MSRRNPSSGTTSREGSRRGGAAPQDKSLLSRIYDNPVVQLGENLAGDVKDTVVGLPTGLVMTVKDPLGAGKMIARQTWHTWSPLFEGDFKQFGQQVYDHPLGPLLDVLSIATLGAGGVARAGSALGKTTRGPVTRQLKSGHTENLAAVVPHTKGYHANPFIRARQKTTERAVNGMAGLLPSWFAVDKAIPDEVLKGFNGRDRAEAWRWLRADKYDEASRRHTTAAAGSLAIAGIIKASQRLNQDPAEAARAFVPTIVGSIRDHAHLVKESDLPDSLKREITEADLKKLDAKARREFRRAQREADPTAGKALVVRDPNAPDPDEVVESYGFEVPDDVPNKDATTIDDRYVFVDKDAETKVADFLKSNPKLTPRDLADFLSSKGKYDKGKGLGGKLTTSDWRQAARDANGDFLVARNHAKLLEEAARSTHFLAKLGRGSITAWKWAILGIRPAYAVNNAVGNMFMYFVSQGPAGARGVLDAYRQTRRPEQLQKALSKQERHFFRQSVDWQDRYYMGLHRGFSKDASDMMAGDTVRSPVDGKAAKFKRVAGAGLYDFTHVISDKWLRRATINNILRSHPEVKKLMKQGHHFDDAAATVSQSRAVREAVQQQVNDVLGQYHYLNPTERAIRAVVPFYTWDRAIVRHGAHLYLDKPTTALAMTEIGRSGTEETERILGEIPEFLRGALPLSLIGLPEQVDGRVPILGTSGLNPYSSLDSVIKTGQALTTGNVNVGEVFAGQMNPFITAAIEQTTGQRLLSGSKLPDSATEGGIIANILASTVANLPQSRIIDTAVTGPDGNEDTLYTGDTLQFLYAYLGAPLKAMNLDVAHEMGKRRNKDAEPEKTGRR